MQYPFTIPGVPLRQELAQAPLPRESACFPGSRAIAAPFGGVVRPFVAVVGTLVLLSACSGGSSSSDSGSLGNSQDPDPVVLDFPIAYVKRPLLVDEDGNLVAREVRAATDFFPGAELLVRDRASPSAAESVVTLGIFPDDEEGNPPLYDVKDVDASFDGTRLVFAMRAPEIPNADEDEQPTWNIWVYSHEDGSVRRIITSDITAEAGHDVAPRFLPDDRIVFASTRQRLSKAILLDEGKPQFSAFDEDRDRPALTLHVMNDDGTEIMQTSFNQSSDLDPTVMSDGRVAFSRWDNVANRDRISLYSMNPDGTRMEVLYGIHSHDTGPNGEDVEFVEAQELPDGRLMAVMRPTGEQTRLGIVPVAIDATNYVEHDQPTADNAGLLADAQEFLIDPAISFDEDQPNPIGRYASIYPLFDGTERVLTAWSQCRLTDPASDPEDPDIFACTEDALADDTLVEADPFYGVWMHDLEQETQTPIVLAEEGFAYSEALVMGDRVRPPVILDQTPGIDIDPDLVSESVGVLHIRSVYDVDGVDVAGIDVLRDPGQTTAAERPARFVRIVKAVSMPDDDLVDLDGTAFGRSQQQLMRDIIGYAPVHPDGSLKMKVPANVAFAVSILDANGRRITPRHQNWLQVRPGEELECLGCHEVDSQLPHGRLNAQPQSANPGAPTDGSPFPNTEPALFADTGESMAEVWTRINGIPSPNVDVEFTDVWTDPNVRAKDPDIAFNYADLSTPAPVDPGCVGIWTANCRITINYEAHIHPIWGVDRQEIVDDVVVSDDTCTACHAPVDVAGMPMVPASQLDLSDGPSPDEADHFNSYRELLFNDNAQELVDGALIDQLVPALDGNGNPIFEVDEDGNLILDPLGNPIPVLQNVGVGPSMNVNSANASVQFFQRFDAGGTHAGRLSAAELKLIAEWLDVGGQYYNNPFDVPQ